MKENRCVICGKDEQELSGIETWHFIAPILAMHGGTLGDKLDLFDKAYVNVYSALKYWDEHHKDKDNDG